MNKLTVYYWVATAMCLAACSPQTQNDGVTIDLNQDVQKEILFSSFVDSISYIPLETTEDCLIGRIRDVILSDSIVFVLNEEQNTVFLFDRKGTFLRKIDKTGGGPGEYSEISDFAIDGEHIILLHRIRNGKEEAAFLEVDKDQAGYLSLFDRKDNSSNTFATIKDDVCFKGLTIPVSRFICHANKGGSIFQTIKMTNLKMNAT